MGGWGGGAWGGGAWGGSTLDLLAAAGDFDVFCFQGSGMFAILSDPDVTPDGSGGPPSQFYANPTTLDLEVCSGLTFPLVDAKVLANFNVPQSFTVEWVAKLQDLPNDFTDIVNNHIFFGCFDAAGPLVGLFFSKIGIGYTGSVSFPGGDLQLDTTFQVIPGSSAWVTDSEYLVIRAAADLTLGFVYLYVTPLSDLATTGQQLRAILPIIPYTAAAVPPVDQSIVSVRGTAGRQSCAFLDSWCLGSSLIIPNLAPVANAGSDISVRNCSIIQLDGSQSFDPEGISVTYLWRLIDAPLDSETAVEGSDGATFPLAAPTGFTDKFHSTEIGTLDALDAIDVGTGGDVVMWGGVGYTAIAKGIDGNGFYLQIDQEVLPEPTSGQYFKLLRQRGISSPTAVNPTFFPDGSGFYRFDLVVGDGVLFSFDSQVIVNVLESPLPRGCTPNLSFIFNYLSDFWNLVEGRERLEVFWSALAQAAATELYTLWQIEYSKSHRDIQRTFNRRWLHYDAILGEPLPELTTMRAIFGGVTSSFFASAGVSSVHGTTLVISSPVLVSDVTIQVFALDPVTADKLAAELASKLQAEADSRFTTTVLEDSATDLAVRINAPFPFTVSSTSTIPLFTAGAEGRPPFGSGVGVGTRTYRVDRSLEGLGVQEDDFLLLDRVAYRIARVIDGPSDTYTYQRVVLKDDIPTVPSGTWVISGWVQSELLDFYNGLVDEGDYADFEVVDASSDNAPNFSTNEIASTLVLGVNEVRTSRVAVDFWPIGGQLADTSLNVRLARILRRHYVPVHEDVVDVPILQELIVVEDDEASLRRNVDFFIEPVRNGRAIRFSSGVAGDAGDVWEGARPPDRLWAEYTYFDNAETIEANFGIPVDLTIDQLAELPDTVDYLSAVRGLWFAFFNGPSVANIRKGLQILLGLPFAERKGTIEEIRTDFSSANGRMLLRDFERTEIVRVYRWPAVLELETNPATNLAYAVGDIVEEFAPLVKGAEVLDYINDPTWFQGILNQGIFFEVEKYHRFMVRVDSAAFNLSALLFAKGFVLKIKPTYTFPIIAVQRKIDDTEISTTDLVTTHGTLHLSDTVCDGYNGASLHYDQPRPAGGGWRNQFDSDTDPDNPAPTPYTAENVDWAFDKGYLCPVQELVTTQCETFGSPFTVLYDSVFAYDTPISEIHQQDNAYGSPPTVTVAGLALTPDITIVNASDITQFRILFLGDPGADPTDYKAVIQLDTGGGFADMVVETFTAGTNTELLFTYSAGTYPVAATDLLRVLIQTVSGTRTPDWTRIRSSITQKDTVLWAYDQTIVAGTYCLESVKS